jgi:predicted nucleic acid-binding protein
MFYAAADRGDRSNARAKQVLTAGERLVTSDHVLVETWLLLAHRLGRDAAERYWEAVRAGAASVEPVTAADLEAAFAVANDFPDQDFSIVDRTCFAVMQRLGILRVASLDEHFAIFRFGRNRDRAFEIVR